MNTLSFHNTTASGATLRIISSVRFPSGYTLSQFSADQDPFDFPEVTIGEGAVNINGTLVAHKTANPIQMTINVLAGTEDDKNLESLFQGNMSRRTTLMDTVTIVASYPDGTKKTAMNGICTAYSPGKSTQANGSLKSRSYKFMFSEVV